jgi:hypothetical protein
MTIFPAVKLPANIRVDTKIRERVSKVLRIVLFLRKSLFILLSKSHLNVKFTLIPFENSYLTLLRKSEISLYASIAAGATFGRLKKP